MVDISSVITYAIFQDNFRQSIEWKANIFARIYAFSCCWYVSKTALNDNTKTSKIKMFANWLIFDPSSICGIRNHLFYFHLNELSGPSNIVFRPFLSQRTVEKHNALYYHRVFMSSVMQFAWGFIKPILIEHHNLDWYNSYSLNMFLLFVLHRENGCWTQYGVMKIHELWFIDPNAWSFRYWLCGLPVMIFSGFKSGFYISNGSC